MTKHKPKFEVCPECQGSGRVLGSAFRGQALSEEYASDPEFMEDYLGGAYDVQCDECNGLRVIDVNIVKNPCDSCGQEMWSSSFQEYPGAYTWTDWHCGNKACEDFEER